jgi:hypothetical protein
MCDPGRENKEGDERQVCLDILESVRYFTDILIGGENITTMASYNLLG